MKIFFNYTGAIYASFIILLNMAFFWRTIAYDYVSDDLDGAKRRLRSIRFKKRLSLKTNKKLKLFCLYGDLKDVLIGSRHFNKKSAHIITLSVHTINCILIYLAFGGDMVGFMAALLFCICPANNQGSVWISGRGYALGAMAVLLMWLIKPLMPVIYCFISPSMNFIFAPLLFLFAGKWFYIIFVLLLPAYFLLPQIFKKGIMNRMPNIDLRANDEMKTIYLPEKLIIAVKTFGYYFRFCLWPRKLGMYHEFNYYFGLSHKDIRAGYTLDKDFWIGIIILWLILTNCIFNWSPMCLGLVWFLIFIAQWCNLVTYQQFIAERYAYLANIGLMYALAYWINGLPPICNEVAFTVFFVYYVVKFTDYLPAYKNNDTFLNYSTHNFPGNCYAWLMKGIECIKKGDIGGAIHYYDIALKVRPDDCRANYFYGVVMSLIGRYDDALKYLDLAEKNLYIGFGDYFLPKFAMYRELIEMKRQGIKTRVVEMKGVKYN